MGLRMRCIRVVVADRHPIVRLRLINVFRTERNFRLVACCGDGPSCIEAIRAFMPEIAVVDPALLDVCGPEILAVNRVGECSHAAGVFYFFRP